LYIFITLIAELKIISITRAQNDSSSMARKNLLAFCEEVFCVYKLLTNQLYFGESSSMSGWVWGRVDLGNVIDKLQNRMDVLRVKRV
jgi:hypothetical protein